MSAAAEEALRLCLAGRISPEVALARLVLAGLTPEAIEARLSALPAATPARRRSPVCTARAAADWSISAPCWPRPAWTTRRRCGSAGGGGGALGRRFRPRVAVAPEASVAAYSLNDPAVLAAATAEIVEWLAREGLIGPDRDVLDLGCGIGRVSAALAPRCRSVLGLDVSPKMVAEARRRHGAVPGLRFDTTPGRASPRSARRPSTWCWRWTVFLM